MPTDLLDLWPDVIQVAPLTPLRILQLQAERLRERTQGRLVAEVITGTKGSPVQTPPEWGDEFVHRFEIIANALNGYRHQLLVCIHQQVFVYPVCVVADGLDEDGVFASSQDDFLRVIKGVLTSPQTVALMESLLARIAEPNATSIPA